ncbi:MAG TPA: hypothetical protein VHM70_21615 [Polyangiaceae bacterium]|nr:hypothetical protein [Polyangiaceae bacterium]
MVPRRRTWASKLTALALLSSLALAGCRTGSADLQRWANTQQGPRKLVSVLTHPKYAAPLRVEAALTLIGMKARGGRRVGIDQALDALKTVPPDERDLLLTGLVPGLVSALDGAPPGGGENDPSLPFKDAAFALISSVEGEPATVKSEPQRQLIKDALVRWALADFGPRLEAQGQKVSMQQMLRELGSTSVVGLPQLIVANNSLNARIAQLIAELGDVPTKVNASARLVEVARYIASPDWLQSRRAQVEEANRVSGLKPDEASLKAQLNQFQEEELFRLFDSMRQVGQTPGIDYLLQFAGDSTHPEKQRAGALAALERNISADSPTQIPAILRIVAADDAPDLVRAIGFRRLGELPRDKVAASLYGLFQANDWHVRWGAASLLLEISTTDQLPEFFENLNKVEHQSLTEPLSYGRTLYVMKGTRTPAEIADSYSSSSTEVPTLLVALGYYYAFGTPESLTKLKGFEKDRRKLPTCAENAKDCEWVCGEHQLKTVGDVLQYCVSPAVAERQAHPPQPQN